MSQGPIFIFAGAGGGGSTPPAFSVALSPTFNTTQEIGAELVNPTFNVTVNNGPATTLELSDDDGNGPVSILGDPNPVTYPFTLSSSVINDSIVVTLFGENAAADTDTDTVTINYRPLVFFGTSASGTLSTEADIEGLATQVLSADRAFSTTFTIPGPGVEFLYYAFPVSFGPAAATDFQIGSFGPGGMIMTGTVSITANTPGAPSNTYDIWRSQNAINTAVSGPNQPFTVSN